MIIDTVALEKGLKTTFNKAYNEAKQPDLMAITTKVPSTSASEKFGWLGDMPQLREWFGDRQIKEAADHEYTITNRDFEGTVGVDRNEIMDDQMGIIKPRIQTLAVRAKEHPNVLLSGLIVNGTTLLAYDGSAFFANRTAPNDNLLGGTGTTDAQILTDMGTVRAAMMRFEDDNGEPIGMVFDTIVCPPELLDAFGRIMSSATHIAATASGVENQWKSVVKRVIVNWRLSDVDDWYAFAADRPLKPLIYQERKAPEFVSINKSTDPEMFMRKRALFGVDYRGNAGYGFFQQAVKVVN